MITQETAARIWNAYREIATAKELLAEMEKANKGLEGPTPREEWRRKYEYQLGVPTGVSSHRLYNVSPKLGESVIRAHIANQEAELAEANEQARIELNTPATH